MDLFIHALRFKIIKSITLGYVNATSISKRIGVNLAQVNQELKLLEAHNVLLVVESKKSLVGKPPRNYCLHPNFYLLFLINKNNVLNSCSGDNKFNDNFIYNKIGKESEKLLRLVELEDGIIYYVQKLMFEKEELLSHANSMAFLKTKDNSINIFIMSEKVDFFRGDNATLEVKNLSGKKKKVQFWSHTKKEIENGFANNETYFINQIKKAQILFDDEFNTLSSLKTKLESGGVLN